MGIVLANLKASTRGMCRRTWKKGTKAQVKNPSVWSRLNWVAKNAWSYASTPQYVFMAWFLVKHRDNFTFNLYILPENANRRCRGLYWSTNPASAWKKFRSSSTLNIITHRPQLSRRPI